MKKLLRRGWVWSLFSLFLMGLMALSLVYLILESRLPNVDALKDVQLQVPLRIYSADNQLIAEYGEKRRIPVTLDQVPKDLINAILATEDQRFFEHPGVDILGLARAFMRLVRTGTKSQGGSTITMQVARNFFLNNKKTYVRKINEILLAIKIDHELSKKKILELYLNKIYLGNRAYGVAAAAQVYYGKPLSELSLAQLAMISGLPKAPSRINPLANPEAAFKRRNHVLERMLTEGLIDQAAHDQAVADPITATYHERKPTVKAHYVAEMIRQALLAHFGKNAYTQGYQVHTTINSKLQLAANKALHDALIAYDQRHGYRGPIGKIGQLDVNRLNEYVEHLQDLPTVNGLIPALVTEVSEQSANAVTKNGDTIEIPWSGLAWARSQLKDGHVGASPKQADDAVAIGDIIMVETLSDSTWRLAQVPEVEGALVSVDPNDGKIKALVGGFNFKKSNFNRVTQAARQPGSSFKPFIYSAALAKGYTLASIINDAPVVLDDPSQEALWRPQNDTRKFYGPTRLRIGLIHSRNLVSIRLLESIGVEYAIEYISRFGFQPEVLPKSLSLALGSANITPLQLTTGFAVFANGGYKIEPFIVNRITDSMGQTILAAEPKIVCDQCNEEDDVQQPHAPSVITPQIAYLMTQALRDVVQHGTGRGAKVLGRHDLAGKTGTTNDQVDGWFAGFNRDLVTVTWVGFDQPKSLHEYGAKAALPMWIDFMRVALKGKPERRLQQPADIVTVRIDPKTGLLANNTEGQKSLFEIFRKDNVPKLQTPEKAGATNTYQALDNTSAAPTNEDPATEPLF